MNPLDTPLSPGAALPLARYRFSFRLNGELRLPQYAGSLLRGQFGAALRRTACMTGQKTCTGCPLQRTCPYPAIFETPAPETHALQKFSQVPNPYVIEPPPLGTRTVPAGETMQFGLVLVGRALAQLPLITYAWQRAFRHGIGKTRVTGEIKGIAWESADGSIPVWDADTVQLLAHEPRVTVPCFEGANTARLRIHTPLRLQDNGRAVPPEALSARRLVTAAARRTSLLFELHADMPGIVGDAKALAASAGQLSDERALRWYDWTRYSSRQMTEMTLGGVLGEWMLHGSLGPVLPWLWLGQWLHVGKNATMGMGGYSLEVDRTPS